MPNYQQRSCDISSIGLCNIGQHDTALTETHIHNIRVPSLKAHQKQFNV